MVTPRVHAGVLLANHAVTPPGVLHVEAGRGDLDAVLFEINIPQALWQTRCQFHVLLATGSVLPRPAMLVMWARGVSAVPGAAAMMIPVRPGEGSASILVFLSSGK